MGKEQDSGKNLRLKSLYFFFLKVSSNMKFVSSR